MIIRRIVGLADEALTRSIIAAFYDVYNTLGFGFLESVYAEALARELKTRGHKVEREVQVKVWFKGQLIARQRVDMLIDDRVIIEIKAGLTLPITGSRQLYNYLRGTDKEVGLLLHFGPEPKFYREYCTNARMRGLKVIIAGAGGAAHLPGMTASLTDLPVLGVPIESKALKGMDSLLSIVQMPGGIPVGTLAIVFVFAVARVRARAPSRDRRHLGVPPHAARGGEPGAAGVERDPRMPAAHSGARRAVWGSTRASPRASVHFRAGGVISVVTITMITIAE